MAVWCRQKAKGQPDQTYRIAPHRPDQTDAELLEAKERGAQEKGWSVKAIPGGFRATKRRWGGVLCTREFWVE